MKTFRFKRANLVPSTLVTLLLVAVPALAGFSGTDLFLASVGRGPGASSSQWYTTVWIENPSSSTATVQVMFLERKQANPSPVAVTVSVPAGDTVRYANILADLFSFDNKFGALRFVSDQKIVVSCRIYNLPAGGADRDTQGQDYAGIPASFGISKGQSTQLLGVNQTSTDKSVSPFRYSFGLAESAGGIASVHVKAFDGTGAVVAEKDYGPLGAYEVEYYPIEDLSPGISSQNLRLEVSMTDGTGKVIAVGSGVANQSNDGTTFEMQFADSLLGGGGGGLSAVIHDATLIGDGTATTPLGIANGGVTDAKVAGGIAYAKLSGAPTSLPPSGPAGGSLTATYPNPGIANGAITTAQLSDGAVTLPKINAAGSAVGQFLGSTGTGVSWQNPPGGLSLPYAGSTAVGGSGFKVTNTGTALEGSSGSGSGLYATSTSGYGVWAVSSGGDGVRASAITASTAGVHGLHGGSNGMGVFGEAPNGNGVVGTSSAGGYAAVFGNNPNGYGVSGQSSSAYDAVSGVNGSNGAGVHGTSSSGPGVSGASTSGYGVSGSSASSNGVLASSNTGDALYAHTSGGTYAGYFAGDVHVQGTFGATVKAFKIDHPLDPERKYLYHVSVESPDMKNIYDGVVVADEDGGATVDLPEWFQALNREFRYQLTCVGGFAPVYIATEIANNRFTIGGARPGMKISWQITGIRKDPYAEKHRVPVEEEKPANEQGSYLHPDVYGRPEEKSVEWARNPEIMRRIKAERDKASEAR